MQINGFNNSPVIPAVKTTTSSTAGNTAPETSDRAEFNLSASSFSSLVHEASQMPEVRSEVVDAYKARIQAGQYPSQDVIAGLSRMIGGAVMQQVNSGSSSSDQK